MLAAGGKKGLDLARSGLPPAERLPFAIGLATAAVAGFLAIGFLLRFLERRSVAPFVWYRIALAVILVVLVLAAR
jgi:undecaprenyl-diphosphatase